MASLAVVLVLATGGAHAQPEALGQGTAVPGGSRAVERTVVRVGDFSPPGGSERVVKGAPYCAEAVHETVQWLADPSGGAPNRITRQQRSRLCRDGEGRTRQEVDQGGRKRVFLRDPVAGQSWVLDPERKTATAMQTRVREVRIGSFGGGEADSRAWGEYAERLRDWGREMVDRARAGSGVTPPPPRPQPPGAPPAAAAPSAPPAAQVPPAPPVAPVPPVPVVITRGDSGSVHVHSDATEVAMLRLAELAAASGPRMEALPLGFGWSAFSGAPRGPGVDSPLPAREIEGLRVNGERTTWQIDAGQVGNERPIQIVREVWTSPELMLTVASRDFDPRAGEVNYRLRGVQRGEPDTALFRVPADYQTRGGR